MWEFPVHLWLDWIIIARALMVLLGHHIRLVTFVRQVRLFCDTPFLHFPNHVHSNDTIVFSRRRSPSIDMGHSANAQSYWGPYSSIYSRRRWNQSNTMGCNSTWLDRYMLQQIAGNPSGQWIFAYDRNDKLYNVLPAVQQKLLNFYIVIKMSF